MADAPFTINSTLSAIAVAYKNRRLIADDVLPRTLPVGTKTFKYTIFPKGEAFTVPDTTVGRRGRPNVVEFGGEQTEATALDYGLEDEIPQDDIDQAAAARDLAPELATPQAHATEMVTDLIELDREVRTAGIVFNPNTYGAGNKIQLAGADQFSNVASSPIAVISDALDSMIMRPNVGVLGAITWSKMRRHPEIVSACLGNDGTKGIVSRQQFAELFELEELLVGESFVNTAKKGQAEQFARAWGKHAAFIHRNKLADRNKGVTFGMTVPYGTRVAGDWPDRNIGLRGGVRVRVGETVKELITAPDVGYFIEDAVD